MQELRVDEGEASKLGLVDIGDDQLVGRRELRLSAGEELVEVLGSFAALREQKKKRKWGGADLDRKWRSSIGLCTQEDGGEPTTEEQSASSLTSWEASPSIPKSPDIVTGVAGVACPK